jgi:hypothetical protein
MTHNGLASVLLREVLLLDEDEIFHSTYRLYANMHQQFTHNVHPYFMQRAVAHNTVPITVLALAHAIGTV